jgi:hypothetical protein
MTPRPARCSSIVNVTRLSNLAVVRMWHVCPASASHSRIVRMLCVTPAVGSLMQWLLMKRNRTTEVSTGEAHVNSRQLVS